MPASDIHDMTKPLPVPIAPHVYTIHGRGCGLVRITTESTAWSCHRCRSAE